MQDAPDPNPPVQVSGWDSFVWPRWLPIRARLPLIAQITGAVALTALVVGPWWARVPDPAPSSTTVSPSTSVPQAPIVTPAPATAATPAAIASAAPAADVVRPAHLNLDVRHSFGNVDLMIQVDGKPVVDTRLEGSGKRFKVFGKRSERGYTKTLELSPGVRLVRVHVRSIPDKFDQTRVERFELGSSAVAALRVAADRSGLTMVAERPPVSAPPVTAAAAPGVAPVAVAPAAVAVAIPAAAPPPVIPAQAPESRPATATVIDFLHSLRSMLIGIAGFVASTATAFVVQEWLRSRRRLLNFGEDEEENTPRRRRRRRVQGAIAE